jgi:hypothetical protein
MAIQLTKNYFAMIRVETTEGTDSILKTKASLSPATGDGVEDTFEIVSSGTSGVPVNLNDVQVYVNDVLQTVTTDYSISAGTGTGGADEIIFTGGSIPPNLETVTATYKQGYGLLIGNLSGPTPESTGIARLAPNQGRTPVGMVQTRKRSTATFDTEIIHGSAAGVAPQDGLLFQAAAYSETIVGGTSVTYAPEADSDDFKSVTLYIYKGGTETDDGLLHILTGVRATFSQDITAGQLGITSWSVRGNWTTVADQALPTSVPTSTEDPNQIESVGLTLGAFSDAVVPTMTFATEIAQSDRDDVNSPEGLKGIHIGETMYPFTFEVEATTVATYDWYGLWEAATTSTLTFEIGTSAGERIEYTAGKFRIESITDGDRDGRAMLNISGKLDPTGIDDSISIKYY